LQALVFSPRFWGVMLTVAVILGVTGPFGTFAQLPLLPRLAYWLALALVTFAAGYVTIGLMLRYLLGGIGVRPVRIVLAGLAAGVPVTAVVELLNHLIFDDPVAATGGLLTLYVNCSVIAGLVSLLFGLVDRGPEAAGVPAPEERSGPAAPAPRPPLLDRLPPNARGRLLYLSMQDHYVDVHTEAGSALVLMRLADAIRETDGAPGLQIHRSHWVARDAVDGTRRKDGKLHLKMRDGALLPVSRSFQDAVKAAGIA
jgi:hypothetical protein